MVFGAENAIEILIINVLIRSEKSVLAHRTLVRKNRDFAVVNYLFTNPRSLVACVSYDKPHCEALFQPFVVN